AVGYFAVWRKTHGEMKSVAVLVLLGLAFGYLGIRNDGRIELSGVAELARRNSNFGEMVVLQSTNQPRRFYFNDFLCQNGYDPVTKQSVHEFTYMLHGLARAYTQKINNALCIGLGVGIVPMLFAREGVKVDVVEINPAVVPLAKAYFDFDPSRVNVSINDGRHYLNRCRKKYDAVILDAFLGDSSPSYLMTREAFSAMHSVLRPGGTLVINTFGDLESGHDYYTASLDKTLRAVFQSVKIHTADPTGNIFFVASDRPELTFLHEPTEANVYPAVARDVQTAFEEVLETDPADGRVLTDDFNPVEFYDAANRERIRRLLALSMTGGLNQ
ncbi:MAG TPA: fused MFS/spermidine synthase, partial [Verrucomicrobiae bacterium]|nr:fused MFS/spermidine synthase [Verrucomicrobiae bacterium]